MGARKIRGPPPPPPRPVRWFLLAGWRTVLSLRLGPYPSPEHVLGWRIVEGAPDSITLELRSWLMTARQMFRTEQSRVTQATLVRYERRIAAVLWPPVSILHRQIVPRCLRAAAIRVAGASQVASRDPHAPAEHQNAYESNDRHLSRDREQERSMNVTLEHPPGTRLDAEEPAEGESSPEPGTESTPSATPSPTPTPEPTPHP
jgi:hypothetical protein